MILPVKKATVLYLSHNKRKAWTQLEPDICDTLPEEKLNQAGAGPYVDPWWANIQEK